MNLPSHAWLEEADTFGHRGQGPAAVLMESVARELEAWWRDYWNEALTLKESAGIGGYSADRLGKLIRAGTLNNAGTKTRPRLRRRDVPMKPGRSRVPAEWFTPRLAQDGTPPPSHGADAREDARSHARR